MLTRTDLIVTIEQKLAGLLSSEAVAAWAFDRFYAAEQGEEEFAAEDSALIAEILDDLMFVDDEHFALAESELRALIARLKPV